MMRPATAGGIADKRNDQMQGKVRVSEIFAEILTHSSAVYNDPSQVTASSWIVSG